MENNIEEKILSLKVEYTKAIKGIAEYSDKLDRLKRNEDALKTAVKSNMISREQYNLKMAESKIKSAECSNAIRVLSQEVRNNIKIEKEQSGSLVSLRASLSNLTKKYDEMSESERNSASGKDLEIHINAITDKIKNAEESTQRFYRNVGSYKEAFEKALTPLKDKLNVVTNAYMNMSKEERSGAKGEEMRKHIQDIKDQLDATSKAGGEFQNELLRLSGVQGGFLGSISNTVSGMNNMSQAFTAGKAAVSAFGKQMLALLLNPVVLAIAAVVTVLAALKSGFDKVNQTIKGSEELNAEYQQAMALSSVISDGMTRINEKLAATYIKTVGAISKAIAAFTDWIGVTKGAKKTMDEYAKIEKDRYDLAVETRKANEDAAKNEMEISDLRNKVAQKDKYTHKERIGFLDEAIKLETSNAEKREELAKRNLEILETVGKRNMNSAEYEEKLLQARINLTKATTDLNNKTRKLSAQRSEAVKANESEQKVAAKKAVDQLKEAKQKELEAIRQAEDSLLSLVKDGFDKQRKEINLSYSRQIQDLQIKLKEEKNLTNKAREEINTTIITLQKKQQQDLDKLSDDEIKDLIAKEQKRIELTLESVKKGSDEEYSLRRDLLESKKEQELENTELTEQERLLIIAKYKKQEQDLVNERNAELRKSQSDAIKVEFEERIMSARSNEEETLRIKLEQKQRELLSLQQLEEESNESFRLRQLEAQNDYLDAKQELSDKEVEIEQAKLQAVSDVMGGLSGLLEQIGEDNKAFAKMSKVLALGEIAINTGKAIAAGVAQAQSVPFPGNIAAIVTTITTVMANIATAIKTVKSAKFAKGGVFDSNGYVSGEGTGTSDSINARLSNGESVLTAQATQMFAPMLSAFNTMGGGVPINVSVSSSQSIGEDMLARAVAKGYMLAPSPIISVEEFASVANRVKNFESISTV